jgi:hypothetical protein
MQTDYRTAIFRLENRMADLAEQRDDLLHVCNQALDHIMRFYETEYDEEIRELLQTAIDKATKS